MIDYVILTALKNEAAYFLQSYPVITTASLRGMPYTVIDLEGRATAVIVVGVGTAFTASIATAALFELSPKAIFFSGAAGAVSAQSRIGEIVVVSQAYEVEIQGLAAALGEIEFEAELIHSARQELQPLLFAADAQLLDLAKTHIKQCPATIGVAASSNQFPSPPSLYDEIKKKGAVAIDMETSALYQVGWLYRVPVLAFRCISNLLTNEGAYVKHDEPYVEAEYAAARYTASFIEACC